MLCKPDAEPCGRPIEHAGVKRRHRTTNPGRQASGAATRTCNSVRRMHAPHLIACGAGADGGRPRAAPRQQRVVEARQARVQAAAEPGVPHDGRHVGALRGVGDQHPAQQVRRLRRNLEGIVGYRQA